MRAQMERLAEEDSSAAPLAGLILLLYIPLGKIPESFHF